ncbi:MAG: pyrroline-5-carboxylate reductase [Candidatus Thiodiazotropha taylori]|nr:pyrroline-5-carboxylate reductase [Candidatus Thiodiazotropha taylori]MCW4226900.1 pyrroline-5-carboxylate reductase [Candidatus Thiodiazotropha endolucinida]MCG7881146.1 pyrroline-5-carboxylate reductase [Candidatus Thiodiazotropha taylori]MCG7888462.1 pyrroline-5-carboxylate reductase [Candidatus Thiodiazotropha taylori]MCG7889362.1 pyrroline-5-carboxylate reductase [Candidatus Thiodiazotropha taylori]
MSNNNITFIGGGNMATSLINGLIADGYEKQRITVSDPDAEKLAQLAARCGVHTQSDNNSAISNAEVVVLAVKPQVLKSVAQDLAAAIQQVKPLVISIAAGVKESSLRNWLGGEVALVRSMPNTPAMIQSGATGLHAGPGVSEAQRNQAESILRAVGLTRWVEEESMMDAVTAVSGSGPAYFFLIMEAIESSARQMGLDEDTARLLTLQTALGAARMALESSDSPAVLRQKVTSPGGTTERALNILEEGKIRTLIDMALHGAQERSVELSEMLGEQ